MRPSAIRLLAAGLLALPCLARSQTLLSHTYSINSAIPDGDPSGFSDTRSIVTSQTVIRDVNVTLDISGIGTYGGVNGDLYVYLTHETGFSVLLNRPGRRSGSAMGYDDSGLGSVVFDDSAINGDVHSYRFTLSGNHDSAITPAPGQLTGTWRPDGRNVDPGSVTDTDNRGALLNSFNGLNPNGNWTLFVADMQSGGQVQLNSWGVSVTAVPEPAATALATGLGLVGFLMFRGRKMRAGGKVG